MKTFTFPVEVEAHPFATGQFVVNQHKLVFPPLCVHCCQPSEDTVHEHIRGQKVTSVEKHAYTGGAKTVTYVNVSQEIDIPYCARHKKELAESGNRLFIILGISIVVGALTWMTHAILYRWLVGVPVPEFCGWPIFAVILTAIVTYMVFSWTYKKKQHMPIAYLPITIKYENAASADNISVTIENDQFADAFARANGK